MLSQEILDKVGQVGRGCCRGADASHHASMMQVTCAALHYAADGEL